MLKDGDSVDAVKRLVMNDPTDTFLKLATIRKLHLTVESYVIMPKYQVLFDDEVIKICEKRLLDYKY